MSATLRAFTVLQAVLFAAVLPVLLIAIVLESSGGSAADAIAHGELYLVGGNALLAGVTAISLPAGSYSSPRLAFGITCWGVLPCYLLWAVFTARTLLDEQISATVAESWGLVAAVIGVVIGSVLVFLSS